MVVWGIYCRGNNFRVIILIVIEDIIVFQCSIIVDFYNQDSESVKVYYLKDRVLIKVFQKDFLVKYEFFF